ncbi:hypothetical protein AGABI1DRAFT_72020 [Agaricus bisporus var. burnettii JB137-S8]|uniref:HAD phosphatase n=1 Tax=Agaricus bisporus var. burnettii (strain JB137-S8 / ATCC MYA-4627 / FGSC 10392) TaxID=597362 RepID=K5Y0B3_AGABU|nr:uncharacterized protein AGABI1DRAFT_72020 [Agaricus bisporus var. burnettii JB137-S8]EKM81170.1 hypothetical protein AGABI1DRAFT_72020 [Agaricus bisporus var. burnettii JB137-S8]
MPLNIPGLLVPFQLLIHPRIVIPNVIIKDIRHLDFAALRKAGYRGAIFDKDNCLTVPYEDTLVPELESAWTECHKTFGKGNVIIVSNSAGTHTDPGGIQSESVSHHLQVPVLYHKSFKPSYSCIKSIRSYFSTLPRPISDDELIIIGDRIFTDIVLSNRMRFTNPKYLSNPSRTPRPRGFLGEAFSCIFEKDGTTSTERENMRIGKDKQEQKVRERYSIDGRGPLAVWTTGVWKREAMGMRWFERKMVDAVEKWSVPREGEVRDTGRFVRRVKIVDQRPNILARLWSKIVTA